MGLGSALGKGVDYRQEQRVIRENERNGENERAYRNQLAATSKARQTAIRAENVARNTPEAKKERAAQHVLNTKKLEYDTGRMAELSASGGGQQMQQLQEEVNKIANNQKRNVEVQSTDNVSTNVYRDISAKGSISPSTLKQVNTVIPGNAVFSQIVKGNLIRYNPNDELHVQALQQLAARKNQGQEPENVEGMFVAFEDMAKNGIIAIDSSNNNPIDIEGLIGLTGPSKRIAGSDIDSARTVMHNSMTNAVKEFSKSNQVQMENKVGAPPQLKLWKGKDPIREMENLEYFGKPVDRSLKEHVAKYKAEVEEYQTLEAHKGLTKVMAKVERGNATPQELNKAHVDIQKSKMPEKEKSEYFDKLEMGRDSIEINKHYDKPVMDAQGINTFQQIEMKNLNGPNKGNLGKIKTKADADITLVDDINVALKATLDISQGPDGMITGLGADKLREMASMDLKGTNSLLQKGTAILYEWLNKGDYTAKGITEQQLLNSIKMNTMIGRLVADYVKSTSGTSVTEGEYERLRGIIAGAAAGDPKAMAMAMETFRDGTARNLTRQSEQFLFKNSLPATSYNMKTMDKQVSYLDKIESKGATFTGVIEDITGMSGETNSTNTGTGQTSQDRVNAFKEAMGGK